MALRLGASRHRSIRLPLLERMLPRIESFRAGRNFSMMLLRDGTLWMTGTKEDGLEGRGEQSYEHVMRWAPVPMVDAKARRRTVQRLLIGGSAASTWRIVRPVDDACMALAMCRARADTLLASLPRGLFRHLLVRVRRHWDAVW